MYVYAVSNFPQNKMSRFISSNRCFFYTAHSFFGKYLDFVNSLETEMDTVENLFIINGITGLNLDTECRNCWKPLYYKRYHTP